MGLSMRSYVDVPLKATSIRGSTTMSQGERHLFAIMDAAARKQARARNMFKSAVSKLAPPKKRTLIMRGDPRWKEIGTDPRGATKWK